MPVYNHQIAHFIYVKYKSSQIYQMSNLFEPDY